MDEVEGFRSELLAVINERQQVTYNDLVEYVSSKEISEEMLQRGLKDLQQINAIASRNSGGILTYYVLQEKNELRKIMIVEDDKNINKLVALSVGKGFEITQIYDGKEAIKTVKSLRPNLVVLDLMLPGADGLEICQSIKKDPQLGNTIVIIISAMDATSNRFKGIKYGADYYIKKPFDPDELRGLVTIFLKKKGKRFDPLIDLPNEDKISNAVEGALQESEEQEIGRLRVEGFAEFAGQFGANSGITILRLISQILQDKVRDNGKNVFVGFLNSDDFVIAGNKSHLDKMVQGIREEFSAVVPFIYQSEGYKPIERGIDDSYDAEKPSLGLSYTPIAKNSLRARRAEILGKHSGKGVGSYTYDELRQMLGSDNLDIIITRDVSGVKLSVGKRAEK